MVPEEVLEELHWVWVEAKESVVEGLQPLLVVEVEEVFGLVTMGEMAEPEYQPCSVDMAVMEGDLVS